MKDMKRANLLKNLRLEAKLTRKQICEFTGTGERTWQSWELGEYKAPGLAFAYLKQVLAIKKLIP